jgi:hypothetical protein
MVKKIDRTVNVIDQSSPRFIFQGEKVYMGGLDALNATDEELEEFATLIFVASLACKAFPGINLNNCQVIRLSRRITNLTYGPDHKVLILKKYIDQWGKFKCYMGYSAEDLFFAYYPLKN